jgi:hypothetical protein
MAVTKRNTDTLLKITFFWVVLLSFPAIGDGITANRSKPETTPCSKKVNQLINDWHGVI